MKIGKLLKDIIQQLRALSPTQKRNMTIVSAVLFFVLFSYPITRSTIDSIFLDAIGANKSPHVWLYSVIVLSVVVSFLSSLQKRVNIQDIFLSITIFTPVLFIIGLAMIKGQHNSFAYWLYIWKEAYIVLLIHILFGYINASVDVEMAKVLYGPIGAINSLAGVLGGLWTAELTKTVSVEIILLIGGIIVLASGFIFLLTNRKIVNGENRNERPQISPLASVSDVKEYVFWIVFIVIMSQFCINLVTFKFNILFEQLVPDKLIRTRYFGNINAAMNGLALFIQVIIVPVGLKLFANKRIQFFIPSTYLVVALLGFFIGGGTLMSVAITFVIFKGMDYSIFSSAKEILYFPLNRTQRYGAKYIADIVVYRAAKGAISVILILFQAAIVIDTMLFTFFISWIVSIIPLFNAHKKLSANSAAPTI